MYNDRDHEAVNKLAMEQISKLEKGDNLPASSASSFRGDFWNDDPVRDVRPSSFRERSSSGVPSLHSSYRSYYTSKSESVTTPEAFYRKTLNAVYRKEKTEEEEKAEIEEIKQQNKEKKVTEITYQTESSLVLGNPSFFTSFSKGTEQVTQKEPDSIVSYEPAFSYKDAERTPIKMPRISRDTKNQLSAIILSGIARMFTTMVVNYARDRKVPYDLL